MIEIVNSFFFCSCFSMASFVIGSFFVLILYINKYNFCAKIISNPNQFPECSIAILVSLKFSYCNDLDSIDLKFTI